MMCVGVVFLALAAVVPGHAFTMTSFTVPAVARPGEDVTIRCQWRKERNEGVVIDWMKGNRIFMSYASNPPTGKRNIIYNTVRGVELDERLSTPYRAVLQDVGEDSSGTYCVRIQVQGPQNSDSTMINCNSLQVGDDISDEALGNRFGNRRPDAWESSGSGTNFVHTSSSASSSGNAGGSTWVWSSTGTGIGNRFGFPNRRPVRPVVAAPVMPDVSGIIQQALGQANQAIFEAQQNINQAFAGY